MSAARYMARGSAAKHHTIIPAPTRIVKIQIAERKVVVDMVVDITHTIASAGAVLLFVGAILTNL